MLQRWTDIQCFHTAALSVDRLVNVARTPLTVAHQLSSQPRMLQETRRSWPCTPITIQTTQDEVATGIGHLSGQRRHGSGLCDCKHCRHCGRILLLPWRTAGAHLDHSTPNRPNVGLSSVSGLANDFRTHEPGCACDRCWSCDTARLGFEFVQSLRRTEISQFHNATRVDQRIATCM